jgi:hypothetical protein
LYAFRLRRKQMEMRVVVQDATSVTSLAEELSVALGSDRISIQRDRAEVDVRVERTSDWRIPRVLNTVEHWRDRAGVESVEMWLGERSCVLGRQWLVETWH